ncbi:hypothetical protein DFJ73DRAFT_826488 [Zopfochytrium polystomum]|nr:hypothetical protein DFJ73DRAFT_826488 [Zopfochytrium polystomum]
MIRSVLGLVVAAGIGCLLCEVALIVVIDAAGNSLTAYYAWVAQVVVSFAFTAGASVVFAVQIYRYAAVTT